MGRPLDRPGALLLAALALAAAGTWVLALLEPRPAVGRAGLLVGALLPAWAFLAAGVVAWRTRGAGRIAALMAAVGLAWMAASLKAAADPALLAVGVLTAWWWAALFVHLALAFPTGRLPGSAERAVVLAGCVIAVPLQLVYVLLADAGTLAWAGCDGCPSTGLLLTAAPGVARAISRAQEVGGAGVALGGFGLLLVHARQRTGLQRRALEPVLAAAALVGITTAASFLLQALGRQAAADVLARAYLVAFTSVPFAFLGGLLYATLGRAAAVGRLLERMREAPGPGGLRRALAGALGDPGLVVAYRLEEDGRYVDASGRPLDLAARSRGRMSTPVELGGRRVAVILHDPSLAEELALLRAAGDVVAVWLDRERLEAELRARVAELRDSRARLVEAGDAERRRIERDLHDGAQQRLAALLLSVRLGRRELERGGGPPGPLLDAVEGGLGAALGELRALAAGILPPVLSDRGLDAALEDLAGRSPLPLEVRAGAGGRLPERVEVAAYFVVAEALANATKHAQAERVEVRLERAAGRLLVEVRDDGRGGADPRRGSGLRGLADRVGALDGTFAWESPDGAGTVLRAELPCGS